MEYNEITPKKFIVIEGEPYEVLESHVARTQQRKPQNQTKVRNLISGRVIPMTFHSSERVVEADLETKEIKYLYNNKGEYWFCDATNPANRFSLKDTIIGTKGLFMKANSIIEALVFEEQIIDIKLPIKLDLVVKEAAPAVKGNTVQGGSKQVTLETGAVLNVPMFINEGDVIKVNTETGLYTERVDKK